MAFTLYQSSDAGAPVLTGAAGSLVALLQACLVIGYGAKLAAGWTRPWVNAGLDTAVFRPNDTQNFFLHINDNGPGAGTFKEARAHCGMTHDGAGILGTTAPQNAGFPNGVFIRKSAVVSALARTWYMYADGKTAYLMIDSGDLANRFIPFMAGKALAISPLESYPWLIAGNRSENAPGAAVTEAAFTYFQVPLNTLWTAFSPAQSDGSATGVGLRWGPNYEICGSVAAHLIGSLGPGAPSPRSGLSPLFDGLLIHDKEPRLRTRGFWSAYCAGALNEPDTFSATINGVARSFAIRRWNLTGIAIFETSDTLDI